MAVNDIMIKRARKASNLYKSKLSCSCGENKWRCVWRTNGTWDGKNILTSWFFDYTKGLKTSLIYIIGI